MSMATLINKAAGDGVTLSLSPEGKVKAMGESAAVKRWLPVLSQHREELAEVLRKEYFPTRKEVEAELQRLVGEVAALYRFTPEEEAEALRVALADFDAALTCFRSISIKEKL